MTLPSGCAPARVLNCLSVAGSDPSGGAGIQADLKTFSALGAYGMAALTALTAQNTRGVMAVHVPPASFLAAQLDAVFADVAVAAIKVGMLATGEIADVVSDRLAAYPSIPCVLDPVLVATSGDSLGAPDVVDAMRRRLMRRANLVTPNLPEAARLVDADVPGDEEGMRALAVALWRRGARAVLIKGGHLDGPEALDVLFDGEAHHLFRSPRVDTRNTHGTGCTLSSAIAVFLARGRGLADAVKDAKSYLTEALARADDLTVGAGHGPVHHFHALWPDSAEEER